MNTGSDRRVSGGAYNRKYRPQLDAPPTRFGVNPRYSPAHPSCFTQSFKAEYTAVPNLGFTAAVGVFARLTTGSAVDSGDGVDIAVVLAKVAADDMRGVLAS